MTAESEFWDGIAEKYAAQPVKDVAAFQRKQAITREHLRPGSRVLEIGCGTGSLALAMSPFAGEIHALDVSPEMVRIANQKQQVQGVTNVSFRQGSVNELTTFERAHFDSVWAVCLAGSWIPYGALITLLRWFGKAPFVYKLRSRDAAARVARGGVRRDRGTRRGSREHGRVRRGEEARLMGSRKLCVARTVLATRTKNLRSCSRAFVTFQRAVRSAGDFSWALTIEHDTLQSIGGAHDRNEESSLAAIECHRT